MTDAGTARPIALVTGATAGIGRSFAQALAGRGYDLVLVARNETRLSAAASELEGRYGISCEVIAADLADRAALGRVETRAADVARPIDLLVNNAGFGLKERFLDNPVDVESEMTEVLVTAVLRLTHAALSQMTDRAGSSAGEPSIGVINVSSVAGFLPRGTYSAAKAWVNSFTEWAANEYRAQGVTVMALCPGFTRTEFHQRMDVGQDSAPDFMWLDADDLVEACLRDYDRGRTFSIPGAQYKTIVGLTRLIPNSVLQRFQSMGRK